MSDEKTGNSDYVPQVLPLTPNKYPPNIAEKIASIKPREPGIYDWYEPIVVRTCLFCVDKEGVYIEGMIEEIDSWRGGFKWRLYKRDCHEDKIEMIAQGGADSLADAQSACEEAYEEYKEQTDE